MWLLVNKKIHVEFTVDVVATYYKYQARGWSQGNFVVVFLFKQNIDSKKPHVVKKSDVSAFAATHYHMSERTVDREEDPKQVSLLIILCT